MSGMRNVNRLKRKLRRLPDDITASLRSDVEEVAEAVRVDGQQRAPRDEGDLQLSVEKKASRDGLSYVVGPGADSATVIKSIRGGIRAITSARLSGASKEKIFNYLKGLWAEYGTKGNPEKNIPAQPARPWMQPAWDINKGWGKLKITVGINRVLKRASKL